MSGWDAFGWVVWAVCVFAVGSAVVLFVLGVVAHVQDRRRDARRVVTQELEAARWQGRGQLDNAHPGRAVVIAWAQTPAAGEEERHALAHDVVREVMPQLAAQLDRLVADARRHAVAGVPTPVGPCGYGVHAWRREPGMGVSRCQVCGAVQGHGGDGRSRDV